MNERLADAAVLASGKSILFMPRLSLFPSGFKAVQIEAEARELRSLARIGVHEFETLAECSRRQEEMIQRLDRIGYGVGALRYLYECGSPGPCVLCTEGCHFATRRRRVEGLLSAYRLLESHPGPFYDVSIVHPLWERTVADLAESSAAAAAQWQYRRLRSLANPSLVAIGIYEVSLNVELNGETFWAGEIHEVVAGEDKRTLQRALQIEQRYRRLRPHNRLLAVTPVENLGARLAYSMKRYVEQRRAYVTESTGRQARRHLPPRTDHWAEHDAWLLSLPLGGRTVAYGCRRRGNRFLPAK